MLHLYVFPDSRAQFLKLLGQAGMLPELNTGLGLGFGATEVDFWSYASTWDEAGSEDLFASTPPKRLEAKDSGDDNASKDKAEVKHTA